MNRPKKQYWGRDKIDKTEKFITSLKIGDMVMVLSGGNPKNDRHLKGAVGKILKFIPKRNRVVVEGVNMMKRHQRAKSMNEPAQVLRKEGSIDISNVMYFVDSIKKPVRLRNLKLENGKKVRAYLDPQSKKLVAIEQ